MKTKDFLYAGAFFVLLTVFTFSADNVRAAGCEAGEVCKDMLKEGNEFVSPPGFDCYWRGVCPGSQACCKPEAGGANNPGPGATSGPTEFVNPLRFNSVEEFLTTFLTTLQRIIVLVALIMIVIGSLMYITSAGGDQIKKAKSTITAALIGLAIAIAAPSFLKEISILLGWNANNAAVASAKTLTQIAINVLNFLLAILGILALVMMVLGGVFYTTAAGDESRAKTGKNIATYAIIGVIVAMSSMILLQQVAKFFGN